MGYLLRLFIGSKKKSWKVPQLGLSSTARCIASCYTVQKSLEAAGEEQNTMGLIEYCVLREAVTGGFACYGFGHCFIQGLLNESCQRFGSVHYRRLHCQGPMNESFQRISNFRKSYIFLRKASCSTS